MLRPVWPQGVAPHQVADTLLAPASARVWEDCSAVCPAEPLLPAASIPTFVAAINYHPLLSACGRTKRQDWILPFWLKLEPSGASCPARARPAALRSRPTTCNTWPVRPGVAISFTDIANMAWQIWHGQLSSHGREDVALPSPATPAARLSPTVGNSLS